eukprot:scaffold136514_cov26-Tisochrysis_lutea.AAC.4
MHPIGIGKGQRHGNYLRSLQSRSFPMPSNQGRLVGDQGRWSANIDHPPLRAATGISSRA